MTRRITERKPIPENTTLEKIMEVATTLDAAVYYVEEYRKILLSQGRAIDPELDEALTQFIEDVETIRNEGGSTIWDGHPDLRSAFAKIQEKILEKELKVSQEFFKTHDIQMYVSVNEQSELSRYYATEEDALAGENLDTADTALNAWLSLNNWRSLDGVIYELEFSNTNRKGEIKRDPKTHEKIRANHEHVVEKMNHPKLGFATYANKYNITIKDVTLIKEEPEAASVPQ